MHTKALQDSRTPGLQDTGEPQKVAGQTGAKRAGAAQEQQGWAAAGGGQQWQFLPGQRWKQEILATLKIFSTKFTI